MGGLEWRGFRLAVLGSFGFLQQRELRCPARVSVHGLFDTFAAARYPGMGWPSKGFGAGRNTVRKAPARCIHWAHPPQ